MCFQYDKTSEYAEYYEILYDLMERWEYEIVEFKEAKGRYDKEKIGKYFSAISNEANLKNQQYGWFVLGVSETESRIVVGTNFKKGDTKLLEDFKYEVAKNLTDRTGFLDIIELFPIVNNLEKRVLMFKIPAAPTGMPIAWKNNYFAREGDSLIPLSQVKIDIIRGQERRDWSKQIIMGASIDNLDPRAISIARIKYKEQMNNPHISREVDEEDDLAFLSGLKLIIDGKVTNAAMLLLGKAEDDHFFPMAPSIMWRLYGATGEDRDYEVFTIPFIDVPDRVLSRVRNLTYRYMPNQLSLFTSETQQYDPWLFRELVHNCIAHSNYQLGGRIYIDEYEDHIIISNPGNFLPERIEPVLKPGFNPPYYRNKFLADVMVKFKMIDTASRGIRTVYRIQKNKYFPMPDYNITDDSVAVKVYGKTLDDRYMHILYNNPDLDVETVYLLDQVQKGNGRNLSDEAVKHLRKYKLVEGRKTRLYLASNVAVSADDKAQYIKNRGFDDAYYRDMIIKYLKEFGKAKKKDIRSLLWEKLPDGLTDEQKESKIKNLLTTMRQKGYIKRDSDNQQTGYWVLKK